MQTKENTAIAVWDRSRQGFMIGVLDVAIPSWRWGRLNPNKRRGLAVKRQSRFISAVIGRIKGEDGCLRPPHEFHACKQLPVIGKFVLCA
jgi:hypothetical protein